MKMERNTSESMAIVGRFDANEAPAFLAFVEEHFAGGQRLEIDLSMVTFIDSTALAELVRMHKAEKPDLVLRSPSDVVRVILELTALDQVFAIDSPVEAQSHLVADQGEAQNPDGWTRRAADVSAVVSPTAGP